MPSDDGSSAEARVPPLPKSELSRLRPLLESFAVRHQSHHRPIALVTSGGTATDLEVNSVRFLDNFSTGLRGAVSVEQFLRRGYAVVHLWREGSAAPYARVLCSELGAGQANHGLGFGSLGRLFDCPGEEPLTEDDREAEMVSRVRSEDPWLTAPRSGGGEGGGGGGGGGGPSGDVSPPGSAAAVDEVRLNRRILNSSSVHRALRERSDAVREGLLLTVPFRTVEEYLAKLRLCAEALRDSQSLAIVYLAAAVSDFYIPRARRSLHKIQSMDYGVESSKGETATVDDDRCLTLKLHPVPKMITALKRRWAPDAFIISFKLETDRTILRHKAMLAMRNYGVHMVIGNILATRHQKVWCLQRTSGAESAECEHTGASEGIACDSCADERFEMREISRAGRHPGNIDELEDAMIGHVVERHFEYIANHFLDDGVGGSTRTALMAGAEAAARYNRQIEEKKRRVQDELYWKRVRDLSLTVAGHALGMVITYSITTMLQRRFSSLR